LQSLQARHCKPLVNLLIKLDGPLFSVGTDSEGESKADSFTELVRAQLAKLDPSQLLTDLLDLEGVGDGDSESLLTLKWLLEGLTSRDLEQLLDCESFRP